VVVAAAGGVGGGREGGGEEGGGEGGRGGGRGVYREQVDGVGGWRETRHLEHCQRERGGGAGGRGVSFFLSSLYLEDGTGRLR